MTSHDIIEVKCHYIKKKVIEKSKVIKIKGQKIKGDKGQYKTYKSN